MAPVAILERANALLARLPGLHAVLTGQDLLLARPVSEKLGRVGDQRNIIRHHDCLPLERHHARAPGTIHLSVGQDVKLTGVTDCGKPRSLMVALEELSDEGLFALARVDVPEPGRTVVTQHRLLVRAQDGGERW